MKKIMLTLTALSLLSLSACKKEKWPYCIKANGNITEETRTLDAFDEVDFNLSGDLLIIVDSTLKQNEIILETSDNIMDRVETEIEGDRLVIDHERCVRRMRKFNAELRVRSLEAITLNGSGNIRTSGAIKGDRLTININGSGDVDVDAIVERAYASINGSGDVKLQGSSDDFEVDINGSGNIRAFDFPTIDAMVDINGSGNVELDVRDNLNISISGSGDVTYEGTPRVEINNTGSGSVNAR